MYEKKETFLWTELCLMNSCIYMFVNVAIGISFWIWDLQHGKLALCMEFISQVRLLAYVFAVGNVRHQRLRREMCVVVVGFVIVVVCNGAVAC